ncbi:hypothetical protein BJF77_10180 [Kocuria sp. CNJ-770]|nr:hypothetical protein BJF77_10180 [Kocuria sp. CNJ-770]
MPSTVPLPVCWSTARVSPKSATVTRPPAAIRTFSGLTSRCTSPARWAAASPSRAASITSSASRGVRAPRRRSRSRSVEPSTCSMTR